MNKANDKSETPVGSRRLYRGGGVLDDDALAGKYSVETECRSVQSNRTEVEAAHRSLGSIAVFPVQEN